MVHVVRTAVIAATLVLAACAQHTPQTAARAQDSSCAERATSIIASNVSEISAHRYGAASQAAERAAGISLKCAVSEASAVRRFGDRWHAANALVVAAELAHQANQRVRAERLLRQGFSVMRSLRPPHHINALTSTLMAQRLDTARRDMRGQWAYW